MIHEVYIIKYTLYDAAGGIIKDGKIKVKNKPNEFTAKCSLEDYMKKKYPNCTRIVIHSCYSDNGISDFFKNFGVNI